jgi:hypothetical protein
MKLKKPSKLKVHEFFLERGMLNLFLSRDCGSLHYLIHIFILSRIKIKWSLSKEDFKTLLKLNLFFTFNLMLDTTCTYHMASYFLLTKFFQLILFYFNCWFQIKNFPSQKNFINILPIIFELDFFNIMYIHHKWLKNYSLFVWVWTLNANLWILKHPT